MTPVRAPTKSPTRWSRLQRSAETHETSASRTCSSRALVRPAETHETTTIQLPRWGRGSNPVVRSTKIDSEQRRCGPPAIGHSFFGPVHQRKTNERSAGSGARAARNVRPTTNPAMIVLMAIARVAPGSSYTARALWDPSRIALTPDITSTSRRARQPRLRVVSGFLAMGRAE
jgi:hypothetical protein